MIGPIVPLLVLQFQTTPPPAPAPVPVAERDGEGMILAALTTDPLQVDEFARQADWNPDALVPSWSGADAEGALSDIVQRMLGDGTFNYDLVTYTVAPEVYAQQDSTPQYVPYSTCVDCSFIGTEFVAVAPFVGCDDFTGVCLAFPRFHRRFERREPAAPPPQSVLALNLRPQALVAPVARSRPVLIPKGTLANPVIEPRPRSQVLERPVARGPTGGTIAPRRRVAEPTPVLAARPTMPAPRSHVRYTRLSPATPSEDVSRAGVIVVSPGAVSVARGASVTVAPRPRTAVWAATPSGEARVTGAAGVVGGGTPGRASVAAPAGAQTLALPHAAWRAGGSRTVVARGGARRH